MSLGAWHPRERACVWHDKKADWRSTELKAWGKGVLRERSVLMRLPGSLILKVKGPVA